MQIGLAVGLTRPRRALVSNTVVYTIVDDADDAYEFRQSGAFVNLTSAANTVYSGLSAPNTYYGGFRYQNVAIDQGATIASATWNPLVFSVTGTVWGDVYGADYDDCPLWVDTHPGDATQTTASTPVLNGSEMDVTAIVQEIVNRVGWVSGNSLGLLTPGNSADGLIRWYDLHYTAGLGPATLTITLA